MYKIIQYCKERCPANGRVTIGAYILLRAGNEKMYINGFEFPSYCEECNEYKQLEIRYEREGSGH